MADEQHVSASHWGMHEYTQRLTQPLPDTWQKLANIQTTLEAVLLTMDPSDILYNTVKEGMQDAAALVDALVYNSSPAGQPVQE